MPNHKMLNHKMLNPKNWILCLGLTLLTAGFSRAQVVSPSQIKDAHLRSLQLQYNSELSAVGREILAAKFDYPFYLSLALDLDQARQQRVVQRSLRFEEFNERTVLAISGNYFAAYSEDKLNGESRARDSFLSVVLPILKAAVPRFQSSPDVQGYAVEISHHVLGSAMGVAVEQPENLMVFLPQADAVRLVASSDVNIQQSALLNGQASLNGEPISIWLNAEIPHSVRPPDGPANPLVVRDVVRLPSSDPPTQRAHDTSVQAVQTLQISRQQTVARVVKDLDSQAHFVAYAPPGFVVFRQGIYLELSLHTNLPSSAAGSRYKIAAIAFDEHIVHLVRPVVAYFEDAADFDGISFSTTVSVGNNTGMEGSSEAVEFFFPFSLLRCYQKYDCTGQQLIDGGTVLVNGERVSLDLQTAEGF
jgi:hypothetical protein